MTRAQDRPIRILLVDDEADLVDFLAHRLLKQGYTVSAANRGAEALVAVERQLFDVAILDLKMPQMDGIELLEKIHELQPFLEAIMLTGHGDTDSALEAGRLHAFRYLTKPYDYVDLLARIREAHAHRERRLEEAYTAELEQAMSPGHSSHEILVRGEELRRKYERD
ncbi:response regulator [bacterium]|nr:response regulator [bacterium]